MTDEQKDIAQHMREWYEVFRMRGKGGERSAKAFLEAADLIEKLSAQLVNQATEYSQALKITTEQRDAAVADLKDALDRGDAASFCEFCKHNDDWGKCEHPCNPYSGETGWEWRGVKENAE